MGDGKSYPFLTGATSSGALQFDTANSLGGEISGTYASGLMHSVDTGISGVRVLYVDGYGGEGQSVLKVTGTNTFAYRGQGDADFGSDYTVAAGAIGNVRGLDEQHEIVVSRENESLPPDGITSLTLEKPINNVIGMDDVEVSTGDNYRLFVIRNTDGSTTYTFWVDSGTIEIGVDEFPADEYYQDIGIIGEDTPPAGIVFSAPLSPGASTVQATVAGGGTLGLWIKRTAPSSTGTYDEAVHWNSSGTVPENESVLFGSYRAYDPALARYELYRGVGVPADLEGSPWETFATLPHETASLSFPGIYYFVLRRRESSGLISQNIEQTRIELDGSGLEVQPNPSAPINIAIAQVGGEKVQITAEYDPTADEEFRADQFAIWWTDTGIDPDPLTAPSAVVDMAQISAVEFLDYLTPAFSDGDTVKVLVRTRRASAYYSQNTGIESLVIDATLDDAPLLLCQQASYDTDANIIKVLELDASNYISVDKQHDLMRFVLGGVDVGGITRSGRFQIKGEVDEIEAVSNITQSALVEISPGLISFGVGTTTIYRIASLNGSGNMELYLVDETSTYPKPNGFTPGQYWKYNATAQALEFTADGENIAKSYVETIILTIYNATLELIELEEYAL
jgi:hypothetical protein